MHSYKRFITINKLGVVVLRLRYVSVHKYGQHDNIDVSPHCIIFYCCLH